MMNPENDKFTLDELIELKIHIENRIQQIKDNIATSVLNDAEDRIIQYHRKRLSEAMTNLRRLKKLGFSVNSEFDQETINMSQLIINEKFV
ncbi:hypothetical protein [Paenibacillus naphthalenovorans]|uniref:Uncharacterized protein n=1 Tax=Paenibacillus naphthalenovorans TaxID=162209 RepID=A0A0U2KYX3_9BACL|nr:hypothetical protein [Paenibacillus naphthalenovorans]ALS22178.1 hypothetical protein IJ22_18040 [Paenibacillus naphthalenovorans]